MLKKIKQFFNKLFNKQKLIEEKNSELQTKNPIANKNQKENFKQNMSLSTKVMDLQKLYEKGEISENDLTINQIKELIKLYKMQLNIE